MSKILTAIRDAIENSGQSRYAIYKATGIDQGQLSKFMTGEVGLSIARLEMLADYLQLEIVIRPKTKRRKKGGK